MRSPSTVLAALALAAAPGARAATIQVGPLRGHGLLRGQGRPGPGAGPAGRHRDRRGRLPGRVHNLAHELARCARGQLSVLGMGHLGRLPRARQQLRRNAGGRLRTGLQGSPRGAALSCLVSVRTLLAAAGIPSAYSPGARLRWRATACVAARCRCREAHRGARPARHRPELPGDRADETRGTGVASPRHDDRPARSARMIRHAEGACGRAPCALAGSRLSRR